jgi:hypothetical protein
MVIILISALILNNSNSGNNSAGSRSSNSSEGSECCACFASASFLLNSLTMANAAASFSTAPCTHSTLSAAPSVPQDPAAVSLHSLDVLLFVFSLPASSLVHQKQNSPWRCLSLFLTRQRLLLSGSPLLVRSSSGSQCAGCVVCHLFSPRKTPLTMVLRCLCLLNSTATAAQWLSSARGCRSSEWMSCGALAFRGLLRSIRIPRQLLSHDNNSSHEPLPLHS